MGGIHFPARHGKDKMAAGPYRVHTTEADGRQFTFNTVAKSEADAIRIFRKLHKHWRRPLRVEGPKPPPANKPEKQAKPRGRKK